MKCPHCGHTFEPLEDQKFCSYCGGELGSQAGTVGAGPSGKSDADRGTDTGYRTSTSREAGTHCAWEDFQRIGFARGLLLTIQQSLLSPSAFFSGVPRRGGLLNPLLYALIVETVASMGGYLMDLGVQNPLFPQTRGSAGTMIALGILIPFAVVLLLFFWSILLHISVLLVGGAKEDFEASFRVVSYASAADLFNVVPFVGWLVAIGWKLYLLVVGVREVHRIGTGRAAAAIALPVLLCCGIITAATLIALMGILGSAH